MASEKTALSQLFQAFEFIAVLLLLLLFSEALLPRLFSSENDLEGSSFLRYLWVPAYLTVSVLGATHWRSMLQIIMRLPFLTGLMGLSLLSVLWSIDPGLTQRRAIAVVFTTLFGLFLAVRYDWRQLLVFLGIVWGILATGSLIASVGVPSFGIMQDQHAGAWRGLWWEKNELGGHMSRAAFLMALLMLADRTHRKIWLGLFLVCTLLVMLSTSKTALLGLVLGISILVGIALMRRGPLIAISLVWLGVIAVSGVGLVLFYAPEVALGLIGRDASLTGRTDIWVALGYKIGERPWLGYGYGAFWDINSAPAIWVRDVVEWLAPTAHNGWLEVCLSLGFAGVTLFVLCLVMAIWRAIKLAFSSWSGIYAIGFLTQFLMFSLSESIVMQQNSIVWVMFSAVIGKLTWDYVRLSAFTPLSGIRRMNTVSDRSVPERLLGQEGRAIEIEVYPPEDLAQTARCTIEILCVSRCPAEEQGCKYEQVHHGLGGAYAHPEEQLVDPVRLGQ